MIRSPGLLTLIMQEYEIGGIRVTEYYKDNIKQYEAYKDNCTGFGNSLSEAIIDLADKMKLTIKLIKSN